MATDGDFDTPRILITGFDVQVTNPDLNGSKPARITAEIWHSKSKKKMPPKTYDLVKQSDGSWLYKFNIGAFNNATGKYSVRILFHDKKKKYEEFGIFYVYTERRDNTNFQGEYGFRVLYWERHYDTKTKILHEPLDDRGEKLISGELKKEANVADQFIFRLPYGHSCWDNLKPITGLVEIIDIRDQDEAFYGRIIDIRTYMDQSGLFYREVTCESVLGYLHDMTMMWERRKNKGPADIFKHTLDFFNERVEAFKRIKPGVVTVKNNTNKPYIYYDYESAWDFLTRMVEGFGGYLVFRWEEDGFYLDWLSKPGKKVKTPIQIGENIQQAERYISLEDMMTEIVPIGGDNPKTKDSQVGKGSDAIRPRIHIGSANKGNMYIRDDALWEQFGVIRKVVEWSDITDPKILKKRGQQYLKNQKIALANWKVTVIDRSYIDPSFEKFDIYNTHPIINAPISGIESLQIIAINIDITNPQSVELEIGSSDLSLTKYNLQQQNAIESIEKLNADLAAQDDKVEQQREALQKQIDEAMKQISSNKSSSSSATKSLQAKVDKLNKQLEALLDKE